MGGYSYVSTRSEWAPIEFQLQLVLNYKMSGGRDSRAEGIYLDFPPVHVYI